MINMRHNTQRLYITRNNRVDSRGKSLAPNCRLQGDFTAVDAVYECFLELAWADLISIPAGFRVSVAFFTIMLELGSI